MTDLPMPQAIHEPQNVQQWIYPKGEFDPKKYRVLPSQYSIHCSSEEQYQQMTAHAKKLQLKHPTWPLNKRMRKVFEAFPSVKISLQHELHRPSSDVSE